MPPLVAQGLEEKGRFPAFKGGPVLALMLC